jgi:ribosomal protein L24
MIFELYLMLCIDRSFEILFRSPSSKARAAKTAADAATFQPPPETETIKIGDYVEVLGGQYIGKCGIISWFPLGKTSSVYLRVDDKVCSTGLVMIEVLLVWTQQILLAKTIKYTKDKGYDVKPGDFVDVVCRPEYQMTGVVQSIDFPMARLTLLSQTDGSLVSSDHMNSIISNWRQVNVPMWFVVKICNASLDTFKDIIGKEVFIIQGQHKGYQVTLYDIRSEHCSVALHGQKWILLKHSEVATR